MSTGVIVNKGGSLLISESNFLGNRDVSIDHRQTNYVIGNVDGRLEMRGNCFVGNDVDFATAVSHSKYQPVLSGNYGPTEGSLCGFIAISGEGQENFECVEFDRPTCFVKNGYVVGYNDGPHWMASVDTSACNRKWSFLGGTLVVALVTMLV